MFRLKRTQITLAVACLVLGFLIVAQLQTQRNRAKAATQAGTDQAEVISGLVESNGELNRELHTLEQRLVDYQQATGKSEVDALVADLNRLKVLNGLVEVNGDGVEVFIDGMVTATDLQDLLNELRNAGAEAMSLNGKRVVAWSAIVDDKGSFIINGYPLTAPFVFQAIGSQDTLERALERKGGLLTILRYNHPGTTISVAKKERLNMSIYEGRTSFDYTRPSR